MKICRECKEQKDVTDFYKEKQNSDGYNHKCKACKEKAIRKWREEKREHWNAYMRKYNKEHQDSQKNKERAYSRVLKCRYGITRTDYEEMILKQQNLCAICSNPPKGDRRLVVDHNHETKKIRGLLCDGCNVAIAILDNKELLDKAMNYIAR